MVSIGVARIAAKLPNSALVNPNFWRNPELSYVLDVL